MPVAVFVAPYLLEATGRFVDAAARLPDVRAGRHHLRTGRACAAGPARGARRALAGRRRVRSGAAGGCGGGPATSTRRRGPVACGPGATPGSARTGPRKVRHSRHGRRDGAALDLAPVGAPRKDWRASVTADGMVRVRHPDLAATLEMADRFASGLHLCAE